MASAQQSETPLWKKLGLRVGDDLLLIDAPDRWHVPDLPEAVSTLSEDGARPGRDNAEIIVAFYSSQAELSERLPALAPRIFPAGSIWVAWPRRAGGHRSDITGEGVRSVALPLGLVDVKVAALDQDWSGLRLLWRRERR
jgi:hypothetical protein